MYRGDGYNKRIPQEMSDTTALAIPQATQISVMFKAQNGLDPLLAEIEAKALAMVKDLDPSVKKDRDLMKSAAYKVSQSKAEIDRLGKALTETQRKEIEAVNAGRSVADKFLTALRDKVKKAADDWEAAEELRVSNIKLAIAQLRNHGMTQDDDSATIKAKAEELKAVEIGDTFGDMKALAIGSVEAALGELRMAYAAAKRREDDAAELAKLRAEAEARADADRIRVEKEAAEIEAKAAEARATAEREAAAKREAERAAQIEADKIEAARVASAQAEAKAKADAEKAARDAAEREAELLRQIEAQKVAAERAAQAERDRIASQQRAEADAKSKREADQVHRANIRDSIANALRSMAGNATPEAIADALMAGKIPHCEVKL